MFVGVFVGYQSAPLRLGVIFLAFVGFLFGCGDKGNETRFSLKENETVRKEFREEIMQVDTQAVRMDTFFKELISNGKIKAKRISKVHFPRNEEIQEVRVFNGQYVRQGDTLAVLKHFSQLISLKQARSLKARAELETHDALISFGYKMEDSASIPPNILRMARAKSGLEQAEAELQQAEYAYKQSWVLAPISGLIANLTAEPFNLADDFIPFCTILDVGRFEVSFTVLEDELPAVFPGQEIELLPFSASGKRFKGILRTINPMVDEHGMVKVTGVVANSNKDLLVGMNVKIVLKQAVPKQMIVPKTALVLRQGKQVVFTYVNDTAIWNYVEIGLENGREYTITSGLSSKDIVITSGNLNLAHNVRVVPQ